VEGQGQQLPNTLSGRIDALLFIGDHYEATITLDLGQVIMAHLSASDEWREGQHVTLSLPAHDIRVWAAA
jgi:hypothetical protein